MLDQSECRIRLINWACLFKVVSTAIIRHLDKGLMGLSSL
jgi:hypothetical protein